MYNRKYAFTKLLICLILSPTRIMNILTNMWNSMNFKTAYGIGNMTTTQVRKEPSAAPRQILPCVAVHFSIFFTRRSSKKSITKFTRNSTSTYNSQYTFHLLSLSLLNRFGTQARFIIEKAGSEICRFAEETSGFARQFDTLPGAHRDCLYAKKERDLCLAQSSLFYYFFKNVGILIDCSFTELCGVLGTCNVGTVPVGLDCTVVFG